VNESGHVDGIAPAWRSPNSTPDFLFKSTFVGISALHKHVRYPRVPHFIFSWSHGHIVISFCTTLSSYTISAPAVSTRSKPGVARRQHEHGC
jgi:hypothetical protein